VSAIEPEKHMTEAEKQIQRLENLRHQLEDQNRDLADKAANPKKTQAERTTEKLQAMRDQVRKPAAPSKPRLKIEGKRKSSKLTFAQIRILDHLLVADKRLKTSQVIRIALNRILSLAPDEMEKELEAKIAEIIRQNKNRT
jgi:hypothetical protein